MLAGKQTLLQWSYVQDAGKFLLLSCLVILLRWERAHSKGSFRAPVPRGSSVLCSGAQRPLWNCYWKTSSGDSWKVCVVILNLIWLQGQFCGEEKSIEIFHFKQCFNFKILFVSNVKLQYSHFMHIWSSLVSVSAMCMLIIL